MLKIDSEIKIGQATELVRKEAEAVLRTRFERPANLYYILQYHSLRHSREVAYRVRAGFRRLQAVEGLVDPRDTLLYPLLGLEHDRENNFDIQTVEKDGFEIIKMQRHTGKNEKKSAFETKGVMDEVNALFGKVIFTDEDKEKTDEAMDVTIPGFDVSLMTVFQPSLDRYTRLGARILAISDLNTALIDPQRFLENGNELFREENFDVLGVLLHDNPIDRQQERFIIERMVSWSKMQVPFALGRLERFPLELEGLPEKAAEIIMELYSKGQESAEAARFVAEEREGMSLPELYISFGYHLDTRAQHFHPRHFKAA